MDLLDQVKKFLSQPRVGQIRIPPKSSIGQSRPNIPQRAPQIQMPEFQMPKIAQKAIKFEKTNLNNMANMNMIQLGARLNPLTAPFSQFINPPSAPTAGQYFKGQIQKPLQTALNSKNSKLDRGVGLMQAGFSLTPSGTAYNIMGGQAAGLAQGIRTKQNPIPLARKATANPSSIATTGLGVKNPVLAMGIDTLAGNPKGALKSAKNLKVLKNFRTSGMRDVEYKQIGDLVAHNIDGLDRNRIEFYKNQIKSGRFTAPLYVVKEGKKLGVEDGKHRLQAYKEMGYKFVPTTTDKAKAMRTNDIADSLGFDIPKMGITGKQKQYTGMPTAQKIDKQLNAADQYQQNLLKTNQLIPQQVKEAQGLDSVSGVKLANDPLQPRIPEQLPSQGQKVQLNPQINNQSKGQSALDGIISEASKEISSGDKVDKRSLRDVADGLYTDWVDRFYPVTKLTGRVSKAMKAQGAELRPEYNPNYVIKRFLGAGGIAENRFNNEFKPILKQVDELGINKTDLDVYLKNRRDVGFGQVGRDIYGSDPVKAQAVVNAIEAKYGQPIKQVADQIYNYQNKMFDELTQAGFIDAEKAKIIRQQNPDYVPFLRDMGDELDNYLGIPSQKLQQATSPVNKIKGSDKKVLSPVESVIANTFKYRAAIEKNNVAKSIVGLQKAMPDLGFEKVTKSGRDTITVWENGQKGYYKVGSEIADTVKGLNEEQMNSVLKVLSIPSKWLRQGATGRNPAFMIPNMVRDQLDAAVNSQYGYVPFLDYARGLAHILRKDEMYQKWQQSGAQIALGELSGRKNINALFQEKQGKKKFFSWIFKVLDQAGQYSEQPTRVGLFAKAYDKTKNPLIATMESREGTLDFARMGANMKVANSLIPFLNVGVQGFDRMVRSAKANPAKFAVLMGIYGATPTIATTLYNVQNHPQEYKEIPQWEKNANFIIVTGRNENGTVDYISIPKGNVIQFISNPIENFISYSADTDSETVQQMATQFISSSLPVIGDGSSIHEIGVKTVGSNLPQAVKPITENLLNKSFYKYNTDTEEAKDIVPRYMQSKAPGDQSYEWTPSAYKTVGKVLNISPLKVQNFMEGYFAGYVKEPIGIYETLKGIADGQGVDRNKAFLLRRFLKSTYPTSSTTSSTGTGLKYEVAQAPESGLLNSADASGFSNPFKKKEQPKGEQKLTEISYQKEDGKKKTIKLAPPTKGKGIYAYTNQNWKYEKSRELYKAYVNGDISKANYQEALKTIGTKGQDIEYDAKANMSVANKTQYLIDKKLSHDELIKKIVETRKYSASGHIYSSDGVIDNLLNEGYLSKEEAKALKKIDYTKNGKQKVQVSTGRKKKAKVAKFPFSETLPETKIQIKKTKPLKFKLAKSTKSNKAKVKVKVSDNYEKELAQIAKSVGAKA